MVHVFQAQMAGFAGLAGAQARRGVKRQAAGPGAGAAVAAAPAQKRAHHALAAHAHAQRAVDEHLALDGAGRADGADLLQTQLPRQDHAVVPQRGHLLRAGRCVHGHLGRGVQRQRGGDLLDQLRRGQVVGNNGVGPGLCHRAHGVGQAGQLLCIDQRVQRHMHPHAARMAKGHGLAQFVRGKVARRAAGVKAAQPQINSISAAEHSGAKHFAVARGGQDLQRAAHSVSWLVWARRSRRSRSSMRRLSEAFSRRTSSAAILALAASSR